MSTILVHVEPVDGHPSADALALLAKAGELGSEVAAVVCGASNAGVADELADCAGVRVLLLDGQGLDGKRPQPQAAALAELVEARGFETVLFATTTTASDVAAALAVLLEAGLNWDLVDLALEADGALVGVRRALQDTVAVHVGWVGTPRLALVRAGAFARGPARSGGSVEQVRVAPPDWACLVEEHERGEQLAPGPALADAEIVVSGGRGVGSRDGFAVLEELADALGGVVGVSLPIVEIGWYPASRQVGQSGRIVAPRLYVACGISGAIQHRIGMERAALVVAINRDPRAAIFEVADLGVIGDLHEIVPRLTALLRERQAASGIAQA